MEINKQTILQKIADGANLAEYLVDITEGFTPSETDAAYSSYIRCVEELYLEGKIGAYLTSGTWGGMSLPLHLKLQV